MAKDLDTQVEAFRHRRLDQRTYTFVAADALVRRCAQIGLAPLYPDTEKSFPWMSEMMDLKKEKNFFETRVIEYQTGGGLAWE